MTSSVSGYENEKASASPNMFSAAVSANGTHERDTTPSSFAEVDLEKGEDADSCDDVDPNNHTGVDVDYAKHEFEALRRRYSELSRTASRVSQATHNRLSRSFSRRSRRDEILEIEDDSTGDTSQFDVQVILRDRKRQMDEEQIRPKNIGT